MLKNVQIVDKKEINNFLSMFNDYRNHNKKESQK